MNISIIAKEDSSKSVEIGTTEKELRCCFNVLVTVT